MQNMQLRQQKLPATQEKFWEMHDYLFEHQRALDDNHLLKYAETLSINTDRFRREMSGHIYTSLIDKSLGEGIASGVEGHTYIFYQCSTDIITLTIRQAIASSLL